jgi:hypothetical protein
VLAGVVPPVGSPGAALGTDEGAVNQDGPPHALRLILWSGHPDNGS